MNRVRLSLRVRQAYPEQKPEMIRQTMEGTLERLEDAWRITYEETGEGMTGVISSIFLCSDGVMLERTGAIRSTMVFRAGEQTAFTYGLDVGTMALETRTQRLSWEIMPSGGRLDMKYTVGFPGGEAGQMDYHLTVTR